MKIHHAFVAAVTVLALAGASASEAAPPDRPRPSQDIRLSGRDGRLHGGVRCAAEHVNRGLGDVAPSGATSRSTAAAAGDITVPVAFHVVYSSRRGVDVGNVTLAQIEDQIDVLNAAYAGRGFSFTLASVDRTLNGKWFSGCYNLTNESAMKQALAIDPATTLNIYTCQPNQSILGYAYYPSSYREDSFWHGAVLHFESLPGGGFAEYSEGDTGTHEVGHYLGLYHTFESGCSGSGDRCADTPAEATPAYDCDETRDTCTAPGLDPIHNFMDYTADDCMFEFTGDQVQRMDEQVTLFRPSLGSGPGCGDDTCTSDERCSCVADCGNPPATESLCSNGIDDDCDAAVDCADSSCAAAPACANCSATGSSCSSDTQCCSRRCKGKPGSRACN